MDWLDYLLCMLMAIYLVAYIISNYRSIKYYHEIKASMKEIEGVVVGCKEEVIRRIEDQQVVIGYPVYECSIEGMTKQLQSSIKYSRVTVGQKVTMMHSEQTGEVWCTRDMELIKQKVGRRLVGGLAIIGSIIATTLLF